MSKVSPVIPHEKSEDYRDGFMAGVLFERERLIGRLIATENIARGMTAAALKFSDELNQLEKSE